MDPLIGILIIVLILLFFKTRGTEKLTNSTRDVSNGTQTKRVENFAICKNCRVWNHLDAQSKCDRTCRLQFPDQKVSFTGNWGRVGDPDPNIPYDLSKPSDVSCECVFPGKYKKEFIGCPIGSRLHNDSCFIWNQEEAEKMCQPMCNKYLPKLYPKWTGNWKTTSAETSSCECEYYG